MHHHNAVVEPYLAIAKARLAETRAGDNPVVGSRGRFQTLTQKGLYSIEIAVAPRPEVQPLYILLGLCCHALPGL